MWHSIDKDGIIKIYDIYWADQGIVEHNIPVELLESISEDNHKKEEGHGVQEEDTPIDERKKKNTNKTKLPATLMSTMGPGMSVSVSEGKKEMKLDQEALRRIILEELATMIVSKKKHKKTKGDPKKVFLYPYVYGIGKRSDYEEDEDDVQLDNYVFGDAGDVGGGGEGGGGE